MKVVEKGGCTPTVKPVDRREIARDLFREHLDLDRISRVMRLRKNVNSAPRRATKPDAAKGTP